MIANILISIPKDENIIKEIGGKVIASIEALESSIRDNDEANRLLSAVL